MQAHKLHSVHAIHSLGGTEAEAQHWCDPHTLSCLRPKQCAPHTLRLLRPKPMRSLRPRPVPHTPQTQRHAPNLATYVPKALRHGSSGLHSAPHSALELYHT